MEDKWLKEKYNPEGSSLRDLQLRLYELLCAFDDFCKEKNLTYSLAFGTLLGAVRHHGYIPWDDDVDVMMTREQYREFEKVVGENGRLTEKMYVRRRLKPEICIDGIGLIDLFIMDYCPDRKAKQWIKRTAIQFVQRMYRCQNHFTAWKKGMKTRFRPWFVLMPLSFLHSDVGWQRVWDRVMTWFDDSSDRDNSCCYMANIRDIPIIYPSIAFEGIEEIRFESRNFPCIAGYDEFLKIRYGNYMKLPNNIHNHGRVK
jgi:lipopolysaccharide cholinephosphotransferase